MEGEHFALHTQVTCARDLHHTAAPRVRSLTLLSTKAVTILYVKLSLRATFLSSYLNILPQLYEKTE